MVAITLFRNAKNEYENWAQMTLVNLLRQPAGGNKSNKAPTWDRNRLLMIQADVDKKHMTIKLQTRNTESCLLGQ